MTVNSFIGFGRSFTFGFLKTQTFKLYSHCLVMCMRYVFSHNNI